MVQTRAKIGGIGKANPHQKNPPTASSTSASTAPGLEPRQSQKPATASSMQTKQNG